MLLIFVAQRLAEILLSQRNEAHLTRLGGKIIQESVFIPLIFGFFPLFLISCVWEHISGPAGVVWVLFWVYLAILLFKEWCIISLGKFWSIRLWDLPKNIPLSRRGPYRLLKHPVYIELVLELVVITLAGRSYITLLVSAPILIAALVLRVRREELSLKKRR